VIHGQDEIGNIPSGIVCLWPAPSKWEPADLNSGGPTVAALVDMRGMFARRQILMSKTILTSSEAGENVAVLTF
jgi:hypothetical protein